MSEGNSGSIEKFNDGIDVAIVGAGIAGSAMSIVLARAGHKVLVVEKTLEHKDVVRGEWLAPWGVLEANKLGLTDLYMNAGANRITTHITYTDLEDRATSERQAVDMVKAMPELPLCLGHPTSCNMLNDEARRHGVHIVRGIRALKVTPGSPPTLSFAVDGQSHEVRPRLVIGADGRSGIVAKQIGCTLERDEEHHLFSGMLVRDAHDWPEHLQVIASEGDANVLAFPQGGGRVRIYLGWPSEDRTRLVGPDGPKRFLQSWQLKCIPLAEAIYNAEPASPCIAYPNSDAWLDSPVREGVVLIGDAAGRNDPIIGQGLSVTHRDVRLVSEALLGSSDWNSNTFAPYLAERSERMARLRIAARLTSLRDSSFGTDGFRKRAEIHERIIARPELAMPFIAAFAGPEVLPAEVFEPAFTEQIVGHPLWQENPV